MEKSYLKNSFNKLIKGPLVLMPNIYKDVRGLFFESWNEKSFNKLLGNNNIRFVQDNHSYSTFGVLRGLHFQINPKAQDKLVRVIQGKIFDVIVDLRRDSETYGTWSGIELSETNKKSLWVPKGFAHGFLSLSDQTQVIYKTSKFWHKDYERSLTWEDCELKIKWPINKESMNNLKLSEKDSKGFTLKDLENRGEVF